MILSRVLVLFHVSPVYPAMRAGVALLEENTASWLATSLVEVDTLPDPPPPDVGHVVLQVSPVRQSHVVLIPVEDRRGKVDVAVVVAVIYGSVSSP